MAAPTAGLHASGRCRDGGGDLQGLQRGLGAIAQLLFAVPKTYLQMEMLSMITHIGQFRKTFLTITLIVLLAMQVLAINLLLG